MIFKLLEGTIQKETKVFITFEEMFGIQVETLIINRFRGGYLVTILKALVVSNSSHQVTLDLKVNLESMENIVCFYNF